MRTILFVLLVSACATAPTGKHVNIPATRHTIQDAIAADAATKHEPTRTIHSMGEVTATRAIVYTQLGPDASTRREEVWVKNGSRWTFSSNGVANDGVPDSTAN
jgi:hypothetical protein